MEEIKITGTISDFIQEHALSVKDDGVIRLGWKNEWNDNNRAVLKALFEYIVDNTYIVNGPADWQRTTFLINKNGEEYTVEYQLDSGD